MYLLGKKSQMGFLADFFGKREQQKRPGFPESKAQSCPQIQQGHSQDKPLSSSNWSSAPAAGFKPGTTDKAVWGAIHQC
jgi:hypothetical protein